MEGEGTSVFQSLGSVLYFLWRCLMSGLFYFVVLITIALVFRLVQQYCRKRKKPKPPQIRGKTMIILGSGGHTKEILSLSKELDKEFNPRVYVYTESDQLSLEKAMEVRKRGQQVKYYPIVRLRDVGQSIFDALITRGPKSVRQSVYLLTEENPDVIICNGPGVCLPLCFTAAILNFFGASNAQIVYIESICRVKTLSMTGSLMIRLADKFIVQWEDLKRICKAKYPKKEVDYMGRLC